MEKIRYGIVGFGGIAENRIAKEGFGLDSSRFSGNNEAVLISACDENKTRAESVRSLGLVWYSDFGEMLKNSPIDAVIVATNNRSHAVLARQALNAGKHVIIEKPAGINPEEVRELIKIAKLGNLSLAVDHMMTKNTFNRKARNFIQEKCIGDIVHMVFHMEFSFGMEPDEASSWRCADPEELGGPIGDVGSHCLYMAEFLSDDVIDRIQCVYSPKHSNIAVEDGAILNFVTRKGISGTIRVAFDQPKGTLINTISGLGYEVYGTEGMLCGEGTMFQLSGFDDEPVKIGLYTRNNGVVKPYFPVSVENIYSSQIIEHALSIKEGKPLSGVDGLHNIELIMLAHESAQKNGIQLSLDRK